MQSVRVDRCISRRLGNRELAQWISQCDNLNHLEFMDYCPLDIMQKLSKRLMHLRTSVKPNDDNVRLIRKFTNLHSLHITYHIPGHLLKEEELLECILGLECLETLILDKFERPLPVIAAGVEKGKLKLLQRLMLRLCPQLTMELLGLIVGHRVSDTECFLNIVKNLHFLCYFEVWTLDLVNIKDFYNDITRNVSTSVLPSFCLSWHLTDCVADPSRQKS